MYQAGLVLEGGGMKGVYTAGVLDFFLDKDIMFSSVYGVSAGACHMCSYLSKQRGRAFDINVDYLDTKRYCGIRSLLTTGDLFHAGTCYHWIICILMAMRPLTGIREGPSAWPRTLRRAGRNISASGT